MPHKYNSIVEWVIINCGNYYKDIKGKRRYVRSPFSVPLTTQRAGSIVYIDGIDDGTYGILLNNGTSDYCSVMMTNGTSSYIQSYVSKNIISVDPPMITSSLNNFNV